MCWWSGFVQIRRRPEVDNPPLVQEHDTVGHLPHQIEIVSHHDGSQLELLLQPQHQIAQMVGHDRIHHGRRLVVKNALWLCRQCAGDRDRALVSG